MLQVMCIQLCQGPDVIAVLQGVKVGRRWERRWFVPTRNETGPIEELVDNPAENDQLYHCISGDFTGYMVFRAVEYEDVQICVVL